MNLNAPAHSLSARLVVLTGVLASGCVLRTSHAEHYFGPVLFRYAEPPDGRAYVTEVLQLGVMGEAGTQWGVAVGVADRMTVAPHVIGAGASASPEPSPRWSAPLSPFGPPQSGQWHLSMLYLRGEHIRPPCFVRRALYGATVLAGSEVNALSVGVTSRTAMHPPEHAVSVLDFDERHPLATRLIVWPAAPEHRLPVANILEEVKP